MDSSFSFQQMIVDKKCMKFDYGEAGNKQHYNQVQEVADAFSWPSFFLYINCSEKANL